MSHGGAALERLSTTLLKRLAILLERFELMYVEQHRKNGLMSDVTATAASFQMQQYVEHVQRRQVRSSRRSHPGAWFLRYTAQAGDDASQDIESHPWHANRHLWQLSSLQFTSLHEACRVGDVDAQIEALQVTCSLHQDSSGCTALHVAAIHGHVSCVQRLLELPDALLQMHVMNEAGQTPLHKVLRHSSPSALACADAMLARAPPPLLYNVHDKAGWTVQALDFHLRGDLFDAVSSGDADRVRFILSTYEISTVQATLPSLRWTLLHEACAARHITTTLEVLTSAKTCTDPVMQDSSGCTALHVSAMGGFIEGCVALLDSNAMVAPGAAEKLLLTTDATGRTALHWSVMKRHSGVALYLLQAALLHGVVIELLQRCDDLDHSALHVACATGQAALAQAGFRLKAMVDVGANVNLTSTLRPLRRSRFRQSRRSPQERGRPSMQRPHDMSNRLKVALDSTSLHDVAQDTVELKTLRLLVARAPSQLSLDGPEPRFPPMSETVSIASPLSIALTGRSYDIVDLLLQNGADITMADKVWQTFVSDPTSRPTLAKWAPLWLTADVFPLTMFASLCCNSARHGDNPSRDRHVSHDDTEQGLCALLNLAASLGLHHTWQHLADGALSAFRCRRRDLAHQLLTYDRPDGGNFFVDGSPLAVSWLCVAAENLDLVSCRWLQAHNYPFSPLDRPAITLLLSQRCRDRCLQDKVAAQARTDVCLWLVDTHFALLFQPELQTHLDLALANGHTAVALAMAAKMDETIHTIHGAHAVVASRKDEAFLLSLHSKRRWSHCNLGLALAVHFNMSQKVLRCFIEHGAKPTHDATVYGRPAMIWAIWHRRLDVVRVLVVLDPLLCLSATDGRGRDVLYYAMRTNDAALVAFLWSHKLPSCNVSAAVVGAVEANALAAMTWMAETDPHLFRESTTLDAIAAAKPHVPSLEHLACARGFLDLAKWLELNVSTSGTCTSSAHADDGCTPTQLARLFGHPVEALNAPDDPEGSPVVLNGIIRQILARTIAPPVNTVFDLWRVVPSSWLGDRCTHLYAACSVNSVALVSALVYCGLSLVEPCGPLNMLPLNYAAHFGAVDVIQWLLARGVVDDGSALMRAATRRHGVAIKTLLDATPPATYVGRLRGDGATPTLLHLVARVHTHAPELIQVLIDTYDADVDVVDGQGLTPVVYAMVCGNVPAMLCLLQRGARLEAEYEGQSGFYYVLHLLPSDVWRVFFQAFLRDAVHGRSLHCTQSCGCKSFERAGDDVTCSFCSHPFDLHSHVPLPPWYQDVSDTYRLDTTSDSTQGSTSPRSVNMYSNYDDHDEFPTDAEGQDKDQDVPSTAPSTDQAQPYIGRLSQKHLHAIATVRFSHDVATHRLSLRQLDPDLPDDDEDEAQRGFLNSVDEMPDAWVWQVPPAPTPSGPEVTCPTSPPVDNCVVIAGASHIDCWCSQGGIFNLSPAMRMRRAVVKWQHCRRPAWPCPTIPPSNPVAVVFQKWKTRGSVAVPRTRDQLVRLKLFVMHWRHAQLLQAFCRWKARPSLSTRA